MNAELQQLYYRIAHAHEGDLADRRRRYRTIANLVRPGEVVVDIGCGDGIFLELVRERGGTGIGIDVDPDKVAEAKQKGFDVHRAYAQDLDWSWGRVDFVSMIHIVEHLEPDTVLPILLKARAALSESGRVFILTPNIAHPRVQTRFWMDITHSRPYPGELLSTILAELGFPFSQWGHTAHGLDAWCYGFRRDEDRIANPSVPFLNRRARRDVLLTRLFVEGNCVSRSPGPTPSATRSGATSVLPNPLLPLERPHR